MSENTRARGSRTRRKGPPELPAGIPGSPTLPAPLTDASELPVLLTTKQAATYLAMTENALTLMRSREGGPVFIRFGRAVRYMPADLLAWMNEHRVSVGTIR